MKTRMIIGLLAVVAVVGIFSSNTRAQVVVVNGHGYRNAEDAKEGEAYQQKLDEDARNAVQMEAHSICEWLDDARQTFKRAEEYVNTKEERELLSACQKLREAGITFNALQRHSLGNRSGEVLRASHVGQFFSKEGQRDDWFMVQILFVRAYDNFADALQNYSNILSRSSEKTKLEVMIAIFEAKGKEYQVDHCRYFFRTQNKAPGYNNGFFNSYLFLCLIPNPPVKNQGPGLLYPDAKEVAEDAQMWKKLFEQLTNLNNKEQTPDLMKPIKGTGRFPHNFRLVMDSSGSTLGISWWPMLTKDGFMFIWCQADQCWQNLVNPSEEFLQGTAAYDSWAKSLLSPDKYNAASDEEQRAHFKRWKDGPACFMRWYRNSDPGEPPLVMKVQVKPPAKCGTIYMRYWLPNNFLMALCFEGRELSGTTDEFYEGGGIDSFAGQRRLWHRYDPASVSEYEKQRAENEELARAHPDSAFAHKHRLCVAFEKLSPTFDANLTDDWNFRESFTLKALEYAAHLKPRQVVTLSNK